MNLTPSQLWRWPLENMRRFLGTIAVLAVIVVALSTFLGSGSAQEREPDAGPAPAPAYSPAPSASPSPSVAPSVAQSDLASALDLAREFVSAWASHPTGPKAWYVGTARFATDRMARKLLSVDHRNIDATKVSGTLRLTDTGSGSDGRTEVAVPTDAGMVSVVLVADGKGGWQVDELRPGAQAVE
ncbi:hypothetical protein [Streptomyces sp. NPDC056987]|uniref:hypothetical protein n=1 Tax=Streptomyces sp. NPDC056987 TaxID=3345988 RepID=UPI0036386C0F